MSSRQSQTFNKLYEHAFIKKDTQERIKLELDKAQSLHEMRNCTFKPDINPKSRLMKVPTDYGSTSYRWFGKRPMSAQSKQSDNTSEKSISLKSEQPVKQMVKYTIPKNPPILTIKKADIEREIAQIQKTELTSM